MILIYKLSSLSQTDPCHLAERNESSKQAPATPPRPPQLNNSAAPTPSKLQQQQFSYDNYDTNEHHYQHQNGSADNRLADNGHDQAHNNHETNGTPDRVLNYQPNSDNQSPRAAPMRSKLGPISANTTAATGTATPGSNTGSPRHIPQMPPMEDMTQEAVFEWLKACTALLAKDPAKYNDPEFIDTMMQSVNAKYQVSRSRNSLKTANRLPNHAPIFSWPPLLAPSRFYLSKTSFSAN